MASKVDVLAVLDDLIADMGETPGTTGHQVAQVRAAVAELIEAVEHELFGPASQQVNRREGLRAALARVGAP